MRLRDENASAYSSIFILSGLRPEVLERVEDAFRHIVTAPDARIVRRRWKGTPGRGTHLTIEEAGRAAAGNVRLASQTLSDSELFGLHHRLGYDTLPVNLLISGDRLSVKTWHVDLDGAASVLLVHRLIDLACGLPDAPFPKPVPLPVVRGALRAWGPLAVRDALAFRRVHRTPTQAAPEPTGEQQLRLDVQLDSTRLDDHLVQQIRRVSRDDASVNSVLISAVADTASAIYEDEGDPAVSAPVHLARWAGGHVAGNFLLNLRLGGLRSTAWTPRHVQSLISHMQGRAGFGTFLWDLQWPLKARLRRRSAETAAQPELTVQISAVRSPRPFPAEAWISGEPLVSFGSVGPYPAFFTLLWRVGDSVLLSVQDETARFDTDRYLPELERRLAALVGRPGEQVLPRELALRR